MAQGQGSFLAAAPLLPPGNTSFILCLSCPLATREWLALQLGFSGPSYRTGRGAASAADDWDRLAKLSVPLLMWAKQACKYEVLQRLTSKREER